MSNEESCGDLVSVCGEFSSDICERWLWRASRDYSFIFCEKGWEKLWARLESKATLLPQLIISKQKSERKWNRIRFRAIYTVDCLQRHHGQAQLNQFNFVDYDENKSHSKRIRKKQIKAKWFLCEYHNQTENSDFLECTASHRPALPIPTELLSRRFSSNKSKSLVESQTNPIFALTPYLSFANCFHPTQIFNRKK